MGFPCMYKEIAERLEEERKRLELNKGKMAEIGGVADSTYTKYASGVREPGASYLSKASEYGLDVLYVVTGIRSVGDARHLTKQQEALLDNWEQCPKEVQDAIARLALAVGQDDKDIENQTQKSA